MDIREAVRQHLLDNYFGSAPWEVLHDDTPLITGGIIDSIGVVGLIHFIEEEFKIEFLPREIDVDQLDTLERIEQLVRSKLDGSTLGGVK